MTLEEQLKCAKRELGLRKRVFPKWVAGETMTQQKADHEIAAMQAICDTLQRLIDEEGAQPRMF